MALFLGQDLVHPAPGPAGCARTCRGLASVSRVRGNDISGRCGWTSASAEGRGERFFLVPGELEIHGDFHYRNGGFIWFYMVLYGFICFYMFLYDFIWFNMV